MALFFQSFRSSSMPKLLLRYALSKLELLEEEALDLQNLEFALGRNTTLEFKDVGVRLKKLERMLGLPPSFKLEKAKVLKLVITIPMDFYTSPITIEVDGIDIRLRLLGPDDGKTKTRTRGGSQSGDDTVVPHTLDLAASFLATQPQDEKKKLEEALAAESHDLGASVALSESSSTSDDDDEYIGTGQPLSLPTFLADFLQGIVDRTQVAVRGVAFQMGIDVPIESGPSATAATERVTFRVAMESIDVEGVTAEARDADGEPLIRPKEGKRHIALSQISACLISEANVFSTFARSPSVSSPAMSRVASFAEPERPVSPPERQSFFERRPPPLERQPSVERSPSPVFRGMHESDLVESVELGDADDALLRDSEDALQIPYEFSDEPGPEDEEINTTPRASIYQDLPARQSYGSIVQSHGSIAQSHGSMAQPHDSPADEQSDEDNLPWLPAAESQSSLGLPAEFHLSDSMRSADLQESQYSIARSESPDDSGVPDALAQSQVFTHEEAESMYLSAFSHAGTEAQAQSQSGMPGAWGESPESSPKKSSPLPKEEILSPVNTPPQDSPPAPQPEEHLPQEVPVRTPSPPKAPSPVLQPVPEPQPEAKAEVQADSPVEPVRPQTPPMPYETDEPQIPLMPSPEDVPTPRGPTRLIKEIISLDRVSVYVPSLHKHIHVHPGQESTANLADASPRLSRSTAPHLPGAFSMYSTTPNLSASTSHRSPLPQASEAEGEDDNTLEVILSPLEVRFDMSLAFLLVTVVGKLLEAVKDVTEPPTKPAATPQQSETPKPSAFKIVMDKISILFLSQLGGVADTAERALSPSRLFMQPDVLLRTVLDNLVIGVTTDGPTVETSIDLEKFSFGYAKDDIISFDQSLQMRTSVMDKLPTAGSEVSIKIIKTPRATRTEVTTLPLLVQLDLQRLDETFSWFGGLSSFLNMSSSVTSSAASMSSAKSPVTSPRKQRGVRFDTPINPDDRSAASENKVDMRIGGFHLEIQGKECLVALDTSAVKMVSRESGLGFAISKAHLEGPYLNGSLARSAPIGVDVSGLRFDFLNTPTDGDLERLLELITPSKIKFDKGDDEIMVDTLLRQRRKGPILRITIDQIQARVSQIPLLACLPGLGEELARLGTVAKYLPEDDRPGLLTLTKVLDVRASVELGGKIGTINSRLGIFEIAQITVPSLIAFGVHSIAVDRNSREDLVTSPDISRLDTSPGPVLMVRMIGDEMEPVIKVKMRDVTIDYRVPTIMDVLGLGPEATPQDFEASLAASVANLGDQAHNALATKPTPPSNRRSVDPSKAPNSKPTKVDILFKNCMLGLNPLKQTSKLILALNDAQLTVVLPKDVEMQATFQINKADILLTDDASRPVSKDSSTARRQRPAASDGIAELLSRGFVNICYMSAAKIVVKLTGSEDGEKQVEVEVRDDLLVLETCADSTQTLISLANGLSPPTPPSKENKYRTKVVPMEDLLASISPEAFGRAEGLYDFDDDFPMAAQGAQGTASDDEYDIMVDSGSLPEDNYLQQEYDVAGKLFSAGGSMMSGVSAASDRRGGGELMFGAGSSEDSDQGNDLLIEENYFVKKQDLDSTAKIWNSTRNSYDRAPSDLVRRSPVHVSVREVHVIWNLFDGYDWVRTRDEITKTVEQVENKALERRRRREPEPDEDEDIDVIGDYLFNSIYIGIPANRDPRELAQMINQDINDNATYTETESVATTATATPSRPSGSGRSRKKLRLNRSRNHKITFELSGVNADLILFPPGSGETQASVDVRIHSIDVFDHIPTSTWKMFATYDKDAGERQMNTSMARLEVLTVKPQADLAASDIILKVTVMPLRLHVDQDALDFITRFFEFKDDKVPVHASPSDVPFLQRVEVMDIPVQLDFKPKRVDYAGLKSGRTTEFMNFIVLDQARMTLRHTIIYGIQGFDRMGKTLNDIWMPDVKKTQLPGILGALAPIRGLVNIGSGFKELVEIPVREYQKDGRILRSLGMGAAAFARTTGTEVIKLGAKVAVGTQTALQGAEGLLTSGRAAEAEATTWDGNDPSDEGEEQRKQISLYADQPAGVLQGLRGGYASLARDLHLARDAIIAVPGEVMESGDAAGLARVMLRRAPTIVFRPAIGASKAIGKTLMGATNSLDPENRRRVEEKYKRH
ncbi:hypothetical protein F5X68DRAFT_226423 [Plectosphaerella plurivora]|uniref:Autophagy-related protein 2 n=1 Tax=Plectosphaerella plurivora TaxID=936078 RepID=A0A9P8VN85_9PEZI|nr:hypothetical protein F5X68DRAFT_226423 [Plectosphaerella plurivora]